VLWAAVVLGAVSGCHSTGPKTAAVRAQVSPLLESLPATATIAWVSPSMLIADATSEDDQSATLGSVRQMHLDVEAVLKGERWQVVNSDTAQFLATIALVKRTTFQPERRVVAGTDNPTRTCDATTGGCRGAPTTSQPRYQTVSVPVTTERVVFVITRRHDGARHVSVGGFLNAQSAGGLFAQQVITLLRAR
jgi:hypothetical protein